MPSIKRRIGRMRREPEWVNINALMEGVEFKQRAIEYSEKRFYDRSLKIGKKVDGFMDRISTALDFAKITLEEKKFKHDILLVLWVLLCIGNTLMVMLMMAMGVPYSSFRWFVWWQVFVMIAMATYSLNLMRLHNQFVYKNAFWKKLKTKEVKKNE